MDRSQTDAIMIGITVIISTVAAFCFLVHALSRMTIRYHDRKENR